MSAFEENKLSKISRLSNIDLQLFAQRVSFMDPDWCRSLDMRDTGSGGAFKVAAPSRPRFARPRFCVRSDLAAFTSADAFSGRSEGTIRVSALTIWRCCGRLRSWPASKKVRAFINFLVARSRSPPYGTGMRRLIRRRPRPPNRSADVRSWHKADILNALTNVRYWG
jgi:hypothetical protein